MKPYYADDAVTLYHGDCLEVLPTLADKSIDHTITDPPYEAEAHTSGRRLKRWNQSNTQMISVAAPLPFIAMDESTRDEAARHIARLATRWTIVFCQVEGLHRWQASVQSAGARYVRCCVWVKPGSQPQLTGDRPALGYEHIMLAHSLGGRMRWNGGGRSGVFTHPSNGNKQPGGEGHPTTKPIALMRELVSLFSDPGELILDPFGGSGTTARACKDLGRRCILIEREEKYCEVAARRMAQEALPIEVARKPEQHALAFGETGS